MTGNAKDEAKTFGEYLDRLPTLNGSLIDTLAKDMPSLAALSSSDQMRLFARLVEIGVPAETQKELRCELRNQKKRAAMQAKAGQDAVSKRIEKDLARWGYNLWLNDMDDSVWDGDHQLTDAQRAQLRMIARDNGYAEARLLSALDDAVLALAANNRRHPLLDYLDGLTWDGKDHICELSKFFVDKHDPIAYEDKSTRTVIHAFLYRFLIGSVARIHGDMNAARDNKVLVFAARQGLGKSHFAGFICPKPAFFVEKHINPDDKDASLLRARAWIWEIGELGATTRRSDTEMLKNHITATTVSERRAYGHFDTVKPCIASYVGTVNPDGAGFLTDTTGNRRFAVVELESIDWDYATKIDVHQVWAQAMHDWHADPKGYRFVPEEMAVQEVNAEAHLEPDTFGDMLAHTFDLGGTDKMSSTKMLAYLRKYAGLSHGRDDQQGKALARSLKHNWGIVANKRSHGETKYMGISLKLEWAIKEIAAGDNAI